MIKTRMIQTQQTTHVNHREKQWINNETTKVYDIDSTVNIKKFLRIRHMIAICNLVSIVV